MNSAALPATESPPDEILTNVRRIYRRICLLRATGRHSEALDIEIDEFSRALAAAHDAGVAEHRTSAAMSEESARVTQAATLAEVLAPLLAEKLRDTSTPLAAPAVAQASPTPSAPRATVNRPTPTPSPASPAPAPGSGAPSITDLLDGMLALESPSAAQRPRR